jgi:hypothetical protein
MLRSHPGSRLFPPAPLTGDVGRGCGDASRALLFLQEFKQLQIRKPPLRRGTEPRGAMREATLAGRFRSERCV